MDEIPVTRAYLESLTTAELLRMADNWGIDIPPDLDRIFVIEELLDADSAEDSYSDEYALAGEPGIADMEIKESVPLPKQYSITFMEVMIRDPLWAFVFWEIKASDRELYDKSQDFGAYYLKVSSYNAAELSPRGSELSVFTIPVKPDDNAWYLGLSPRAEDESSPGNQLRYRVELCASMKGEEIVVVAAEPFGLPGLRSAAPGEAPGTRESSLVRLSGYEDFQVVRNNERTQRAKKAQAESYE